ncbi:MAG: methyltransferase [Bacteroidota bacterium]
MQKLTSEYWDNRYKNDEIGWDLGKVSTPLKSYIDQINDKSVHILVPGAGNGHEVEYLFKNGFNNVYVVDISAAALDNLLKRIPTFPKDRLFCADFFNFESKLKYDLILEQTFFCALNPSLREAYSLKMHELLKSEAKLVGVLFDFPLSEKGPPFGGSLSEYQDLFEDRFQIQKMERCLNSDGNRKDKELFISIIKP